MRVSRRASSRGPGSSWSCAGRWYVSTAPIRRATPPRWSRRSRPCSTLRTTASSIAGWSAGRRRSISWRGSGGERRLVLNGHLDTFPIGEARWEHDPLGGDVEDGRIYGRGACDMKAGVAALALAFVTLAEFCDAWSGELVLTLVGDEETGGRWGTQFLLANVERGDGGREPRGARAPGAERGGCAGRRARCGAGARGVDPFVARGGGAHHRGGAGGVGGDFGRGRGRDPAAHHRQHDFRPGAGAVRHPDSAGGGG